MTVPSIVLTTVGLAADAQRLAHVLVEERLAACVNIVSPVVSIYRWQGEVHEDPELLLVIKTTEEGVEPLRERLLAIHPYEVPEFLALPVAAVAPAYAAWLAESVGLP